MNSPGKLRAFFFIGILIYVVAGLEICKPHIGHCTGQGCDRESRCENGTCQVDGSCQCNPCFTGDTCGQIDDKHYPYFLKDEETIFIDASHTGLLYQAAAVDDDKFKTCIPGSSFPCPCGKVYYELIEDYTGDGVSRFEIGDNGDISVRKGTKLKGGEAYQIDVAASNYHENGDYDTNVLSIDILKLKINVQESNSIEEFLQESETNDFEAERQKYTEESNANLNLENDNDYLESSLNRVKRHAFGPNKEDTNLSLAIVAGGQGTLYPGNSTDFELKIILPVLSQSDPLDFKVEIYVMDTISGVTTLALCDVKVKSIGSEIKKASDGLALTNASIQTTMSTNDYVTNIYDRAILDFGKIFNTDVTGGTAYAPSTIIVSFTSVMVPNTDYKNASAIVTAGAEYSNETYVWVSQAVMPYSTDVSTFGANVTCKGPDTINEMGGAQFDIEAYLTNPMDTVEVEIFTPNNLHDLFSVTSIRLVARGESHACIVPKENDIFYESVSGETYHRAVLKFNILVKDGKAGDVISPENKLDISFTIRAHNAIAGEILEIGAGLLIGTHTIWTAHSTITVQGPVGAAVATTAITLAALDQRNGASPEVRVGQSATYAVKVDLKPAPNPTLIDCSSSVSGTKICGVKYGRSGKYAASFPDLLEKVVYTDTTASWIIEVLNGVTHPTDQASPRDTTQEFVTLEVSVIFLADPSTTTTSVTCNGVPLPITATLSTKNATEDISGTAIQLGNDTSWYVGSHAGFVAEIYFPPNGIPYTKTVLETSGDFFQTAYGSRICAVQILDIGRGAACMAKISSQLETKSVYKKALNSSAYMDSVQISFGEMCGSFISNAEDDDNNFTIRVVYDMPLGQAGLTGPSTFNLSVGMLFDDTMIWTGWSKYDVVLTAPAAPLLLPYFFTYPGKSKPANDQNFEQFKPFITRAIIKGHPGSVARYKIKATTTDVTIIQICRIIFANVGKNYACLDTLPYGKHKDPTQVVKIIHAPETWVDYAELDMGIVRNFGLGDIYTSPIADEDAIEIGIIARGIIAGSANVTIEYTDGRAPAVALESHMYTIVAPTEAVVEAIAINVTGIDGTMDYYVDVMKQVEVVVTVPKGYHSSARLEIVNENPTLVTLCYAGVAWAGTNVPCVIPHLIIPTKTLDASGFEVVSIDFGRLCYFDSSDNLTESTVRIRAGFMPDPSLAEATFKVKYYEGIGSTTPKIGAAYDAVFTIVKSAGEFDSGNISLSGVDVYPVDNSTILTNIEPGTEFWFGIYIKLPPFITIPAEFGVMTTSFDGHATATVHGFRWGDTQGMNIGCIQNLSMYDYELFQNASQDSIPMYHESQTDTMVAKLKYLTNTGLSHLQMNEKPEDDLAMLEAHLLIADHEKLLTGQILTISFSVKIGSAIVVYEKNYTFIKPATNNVMVLETEFFFTEPTAAFTDIYSTGEKIKLTGRLRHVWNVSHIEAYDARVRIMVPNYVKFANDTMPLVTSATVDTTSINITSNFTSLDVIEFDIDFLFFTDIIEFNMTLSIDPDSSDPMPKGLGLLEATALMRLVCRESLMGNPAKYCAKTEYVNYYVQGTDCFDNLTVNTFQACQFHASTAIDSTTVPSNAASLTPGVVWSPAVRDSAVFDHYIDIDFLRKTRVTMIEFPKEGKLRKITKFSLQTSYDGNIFSNACLNNTIAPGLLPPPCRMETRYARIIIEELDDVDETIAIGIKFKWYGCSLESILGTCTLPETILTTNSSVWRHAAYDLTNKIIYFCDYSPVKERMACYSANEATPSTWNALPSYVTSLEGYDAGTTKMYAWDSKRRALVGSSDGVNWALVDENVRASLAPTAPTSLPGKDAGSFGTFTLGSWTADFFGLNFGGNLKVKWNTCCG